MLKQTRVFIANADHEYGEGAYIYDKVDLIDRKTKQEIECPDHGTFFSFPDYFLHRAGCPECRKTGHARGYPRKREKTNDVAVVSVNVQGVVDVSHGVGVKNAVVSVIVRSTAKAQRVATFLNEFVPPERRAEALLCAHNAKHTPPPPPIGAL